RVNFRNFRSCGEGAAEGANLFGKHNLTGDPMNQVAKFNKPRLIPPGSVILKCVDGHWKDRDGLTPASEMLVTDTAHGLQCWKNTDLLDEIVEQPDEPLPNPGVLNAQVPEAEWGVDLNGEPQKPWRETWAAYLVDTVSAIHPAPIAEAEQRQREFDRLGDRGRARQARALLTQPCLQGGQNGCASFLAHAQAFFGAQAVDVALDVEQRVNALDFLQRDRRDRRRILSTPGIGRNVRQFEELPPCM